MQLAAPKNTGTIGIRELWCIFQRNLHFICGTSILFALIGVALSYTVKPTFVSKALILPPQQQQGVSSIALSSIGGLSGLGGTGKNSVDHYISLMQSNSVLDAIIDSLELKKVYGSKTKQDARNALIGNTQITAGKKDGLIAVEVEDISPQRAALIANKYASELARLAATVATTEARQRREFYARQLSEVEQKLKQAELGLMKSNVDEGIIQSDPKIASEMYLSIKSQITAQEIRIKSLEYSVGEASVEMRQAKANLIALKSRLSEMRKDREVGDTKGYLEVYREFRYQEKLRELLSQQYESAKLDESKRDVLVQVIDEAEPAERKFKPKRIYWGGAGAIFSVLMLSVGLVGAYLVTGKLLRMNFGWAGIKLSSEYI